MWQRLLDASAKENSKSIYSFAVSHVNGIIIGNGPSVNWGTPHPYGWDKLNEVIDYLYNRLDKEGFTGRDHSRKSCLSDIKEKYGGIRLYMALYDKDVTAYKSILYDALQKFPGSAPYFQVDGADETEVFVGIEKEFGEWKSKLKTGDLEKILSEKLNK